MEKNHSKEAHADLISCLVLAGVCAVSAFLVVTSKEGDPLQRTYFLVTISAFVTGLIFFGKHLYHLRKSAENNDPLDLRKHLKK